MASSSRLWEEVPLAAAAAAVDDDGETKQNPCTEYNMGCKLYIFIYIPKEKKIIYIYICMNA